MADAAIQFLMENLSQLLLYNAELLRDAKVNVESLYDELSMLKAFLRDSSEKQNEYEVVKQFVKEIRDVTYDAEDVIDAFIIDATLKKNKNVLKKMFHFLGNPKSILDVARQIEELRQKAKGIRENKMFSFEALQVGDSPHRGARVAPVVEEDNVVGFVDVIEHLVNRLNGDQEDLDIITVVGMGGLGKTTVARKVYTDPRIEYEFYKRAWVFVSQEFTRKDVFISILSSIAQSTDDLSMMDDQRLAEILRKHLQDGKYLIVLDDVWTSRAWDHLKIAFPDKKNKSRIMLTSRNREVAVHANPNSEYQLRFLEDEESFELLHKKVFRNESFPQELKDLGWKIAKKCEGLPLAIVVIAGLLMKRTTPDWWTDVANSVKEFVARDPQQCRNVLALSYKHLPYHLKACFLYFGIFPEDYEIPVWKLVRLWVAEGFIQRIGEVQLEVTAEEHLEDLVDRNLVLVEKRRANGRIKTCRVHDMMRDLCLREAEEENFFKELKGPMSGLSLNPIRNKDRRLCIHSQIADYLFSKPLAPCVRSLLCFASEEIELPVANISFVTEAFKLIRVLDIKAINFPRFPADIIQLIHLRYLALSGEIKILPPKMSQLSNIQTLIVETTSRTLEIKADLSQMSHLRHLYTNASSQLQDPTKGRKNEESRIMSNIQTISTISPESCSELSRTRSLKKLGIRGKLLTLMEVKGGSSLFDDFRKLEKVETMKLLNDAFPLPPPKGKLQGLPQTYKFPPNLKKLTLSNTLLEWKHMETLAKLEFLEILKLKEHAFAGWLWEGTDGGFRHLKMLLVERLDLEKWNASSGQFPRLQRLVLNHCEKLEEIPSGLGDVSALRAVELYRPTKSAAASARKIQEQRQLSGIKLVIFPPDV